MSDDEAVVMDPRAIHAVLSQFSASRGLLELTLDRQQHFAASLIHLGALPQVDAPSARDEPLSLYISPLEPASGNLAIRQSRNIRMRFPVEASLYEARVEFRNVVTHGNQRLIQLAYPSLLRQVGRRKAKRHQVPEQRVFRVVSRHYGGRESQGHLVDISLQGMCVQLRPLEEPFQQGERIKTEILVRREDVQKILIQGEVAWHFRFRQLQGQEYLIMDRYGICFHTLNAQQEGRIRVLLHVLDNPSASPDGMSPANGDGEMPPPSEELSSTKGFNPDDP